MKHAIRPASLNTEFILGLKNYTHWTFTKKGPHSIGAYRSIKGAAHLAHCILVLIFSVNLKEHFLSIQIYQEFMWVPRSF